MRGIYKRGNIYWVAYKAANRVIRESTGTPDRKLAEASLLSAEPRSSRAGGLAACETRKRRSLRPFGSF